MNSPFPCGRAALGALLVTSAPALANVRLPSILSDGVVLQREKRVQIFGFAAPEETVRVRASWGASSEEALTDQDGRWSTTIVTPAAGGPFTLEVRGKNVVLVSDVLVGEVWLCSGQSNMEMPVAAREGGYTGVIDWEREVANAHFPALRIFTVSNAVAVAPRDDLQGGWSQVTPDTIRSFSATAYFFGRKLHQDLGVPVGLVAASYGATPAESWTSGITLATFPEFADEVLRLAREARAPAAAALERGRAIESWIGAIEEVDHGLRDGLATTGFDDSHWQSAIVPGALAGDLMQHDGVVWMRRAFTLPDALARRDVVLALGPIDNFDVTFVDGLRVGATSDQAASKTPRAYTLPASLCTPGRHVIAVRIVDTGGAGGILGSANDARVRVGSESIPLGGEWRVRAGQKLPALPRRPSKIDLVMHTPSSLYNAMIAPLVRFSFRGVIWYQGESNCTRAAQYRRLFPALIADWRARFSNPDMPFYFVQIAPYAYAGDAGEASELREAQRLALAVPNTGMVVTSDIGDEHDIHPKNKQEVGRRLALWALAKTYGRDVECSGPILRGVTIEHDPRAGGDSARLEFDHADGLRLAMTVGQTPIEVEISPGLYAPANVRIDGNVVTLTHAGGHVLSARMGAKATSGPTLENGMGLPASSFRSQNDVWITDRVRAAERWRQSGNTLTLSAPIASADEGIPLGNGLMGAMLWGAGHELSISLDRSDAWDLRRPDGARSPEWNWERLQDLVRARDEGSIRALFDAPYEDSPFPARLPPPRMRIPFVDAELTSFTLDLAQAEGRVTLNHGALRAFVSAAIPIAMLRIDGVELAPAAFGEGLFDCRNPASLGVRAEFTGGEREARLFLSGPSGFTCAIVAVGRHSAGGTEIAIAIVDGAESSDPRGLAFERASKALDVGYGSLLGQHAAIAQGAAGGASITLPDARLQIQYDLARHLMVSGSRRGSPPMPMQGVWTSDAGPSASKGEYSNEICAQATYGSYATAALFDSGLAFLDFNWKLLPSMREFAREFYRVDGAVLPGTLALDGAPLGGCSQYAFSPANGAWTAEIFARHWRVTGDSVYLQKRAYPWCSAIGDALLALAPLDAQGKRKLPLSSSPEFHGNTMRAWLAPNSNYDLALMRSSFANLASMAGELGRTEDAAKWTRALTELDDFDLDARGALTIARGEPYAASQRNLSHALAIHPLGSISIEGPPRERATVDATLDEILERGTSAWSGRTYAWMSCLAARGGRAETALRFLRDFESGFTLRNGLHCNGDQSLEGLALSRERAFTIDGNMLAMEAVHEMLLQSWRGVVRVFPSVSSAWPDVSFDGLWAEGGFAVTARRSGGLTQEVRIRATRSAKLRLRDPFPGASPTWNRTPIARDGSDWVTTLQLGEELVGTRVAPR